MYAIRGEAAAVSVLGTPTAYGPQVQSYDFEDILGFPIADRPTKLTGYFIYEPVADAEYLSINVTVTKYLGNGDRMVVGTGGRLIANTIALDTVYTQFEATINYYFPDLPDTISISVGIQPSSGSVGSVFYVDNLSLDPRGVTSAGDGRSSMPSEKYALQQNYPNPFNPSTTIRYSLPTSGFTSLRVYDLVGEEVATLVNEEQPAGDHAVEFDAAGQTSGVYFYRLQVGSFIQTRRMLLLR